MTEEEVAEETTATAAEGTEAVDELMDHVAALLQSQMHTANQHLRKRAARLLAPLRTKPGTGTSTSAHGDEGAAGADPTL